MPGLCAAKSFEGTFPFCAGSQWRCCALQSDTADGVPSSYQVGMPAQTSLETLGSFCLPQDAGQQRTTVQPNYAKVTSAVEDNIEHLMRAYGSLAAEIDPRIG